MNKSRVIVSLDYSNENQALEFCKKVNPTDCKIKVGKELFTAEGPALIEKLRVLGFEIFLDLKYHDIPNTVAKACRAALDRPRRRRAGASKPRENAAADYAAGRKA